MTPQIRNGIAIFNPQGFIDGNNAPQIMTSEDLKFLSKVKVRGIMLSFAKVIFFNKNGINYLSNALLELKKERDVEVGIVSYKTSVYDQLIHFFKGTPDIHLFQSLNVLDLLVDGKKEDNTKVIIHNKDSDQRGNLIMRLKEKGIEEIDIAKTPQELKTRVQQSPDQVVVDISYLTQFSKKVPYYTKDNAIIYNLTGYIDGSIKDNFDFEYYHHSLAIGFNTFIFDCANVNSLNSHAVNFFNTMAVDGAEFGISVCITGFDYLKIPETLLIELKAGGIFFEDNVMEALGNEEITAEDNGAQATKETKTLSKKLVKEVPIFIDATVETIEVMTGAKSNKESVNIGEFNIADDKEYFSASVGFFGGIDGMLFLFFPREIVKKACVLLLGEESENISEELDALSELINIITGRVKSMLINQKKLSIKNTLPRTFSNIDKTKHIIGNRKGIYVQMSFDNEPFYFFLTR